MGCMKGVGRKLTSMVFRTIFCTASSCSKIEVETIVASVSTGRDEDRGDKSCAGASRGKGSSSRRVDGTMDTAPSIEARCDSCTTVGEASVTAEWSSLQTAAETAKGAALRLSANGTTPPSVTSHGHGGATDGRRLDAGHLFSECSNSVGGRLGNTVEVRRTRPAGAHCSVTGLNLFERVQQGRSIAGAARAAGADRVRPLEARP
eukprot:scaffold30241_cov28-Tisochrysis_lutea.AAC.8